MKLLLATLFALMFMSRVQAQVEPYGQTKAQDLELNTCSFEPDAGAMILFKRTKVTIDDKGNYVSEIHNRLKILKAADLKLANVSLPPFFGRGDENITALKAETFNLVNNKVVVSPVTNDQMFNRKSDKNNITTISFLMPQVTVGSVIEYSYKFITPWFARVSTFAFQDVVPVRYAFFDCTLPQSSFLTLLSHPQLSFTTDTVTTETVDKKKYQHWLRAMSNVPSFRVEPMMSSLADNLERVEFVHLRYKKLADFRTDTAHTWTKLAINLQFAQSFNQKINFKGEKELLLKGNAIKDTLKRVAFLFDYIKNKFNVDGSDDWSSGVDVEDAWTRNTATPSELNLILYYLLKKINVNCNLLLVSTKDYGAIDPNYPYLDQFTRIVVYVQDNDKNFYILDGSDKENVYNEVPQDLLNTYALSIGMFKGYSGLIFINNKTAIPETVLIQGSISPNAELKGRAQLSSVSYSKRSLEKAYATIKPEKYKDVFSSTNDIKVDSVTLQNNKVDSLPLVQNIKFTSELVTSDKYIFLNPCLFNGTNPFVKQTRITDIDFGFLTNTNITCVYTIPKGYKLSGLPAGLSMTMPDESIVFKRFVMNDNGTINLRYVINLRRSYFDKAEYPSLYDFYKKMYAYINEQIIFEKI